MIDHFYSNPKVLKRLHLGPLGGHIDSFAQILIVQGYKPSTAKHKIRIVADLSCTGARKNGHKSCLIPPHLPVELSDPS